MKSSTDSVTEFLPGPRTQSCLNLALELLRSFSQVDLIYMNWRDSVSNISVIQYVSVLEEDPCSDALPDVSPRFKLQNSLR